MLYVIKDMRLLKMEKFLLINEDFGNDLKEVNKGFYVFTEKRVRHDVCVTEYSDGRVEKMDRYIKYNTVSDKCDDVMKALDIAKAYSLEHNTRCVVAMAVFGYDRYMDFYI